MKKEMTLVAWEVWLLFFLVGCLAYRYRLPALAGLALMVCMVTMVRTRTPIYILLLMGCMGFGYTALRMPPPKNIDFPVSLNTAVSVTGQVTNAVWRFDKKLYVYAENIRIDNVGQESPLRGTLLIVVRQAEYAPFVGQRFHARVKIRPVHSLKNPGCWDGETYWYTKGVYWKTYVKDMDASIGWEKYDPSLLEGLRRDLRSTLIHILPEDRGRGLAMALLLGDKSYLNQEIYGVFQHAGIVHSLALSGLHLGFMASFGWGVAWVLGFFMPRIYLCVPRPKLAALLGMPLVLFYMWLGGFTPSLMRSGIMLASWAGLLLCNRGRVVVDGIFLAILLIVFWAPQTVFSISFQFSVLAVAGIVFGMPTLQSLGATWANGYMIRRIVVYSILIVAVSIIANMSILPLQAWNFGTLSGHVYYNILWLPVLGFIILPLGFVGLVFTGIPFLETCGAGILTGVGWILGKGYTLLRGVETSGFLQSIQVLRPKWQEIIGFYTLVVIFLWVWKYRKKADKKMIIFFGLALLILCWPVLSGEIHGLQKKLRMVIFDTGMSQAIYMDLPGGKRIMVDGGGSWNKNFDMGKAVIVPAITWGMPPFLDAIYLTHSDCDHLGGLLYPLETCHVGTFYFNGWYPSSVWDRNRLIAALDAGNVRTCILARGQKIVIDKDVTLEILHPAGDLHHFSNNNRSLVIRVVVRGKGKVLIPGDIEQKGIAELLGRTMDMHAEVLILPHHGSGSSYSEKLYDRVMPTLAIAAAGFNNRYGFPAPEVTESLKKRKCPVLTTARYGAIELVWDIYGRDKMKVKVMRESVPDSAIFWAH